MNPAQSTCSHAAARWLPVRGLENIIWEYSCDACRLTAYSITLEDARRVFRQNAERLKVEEIQARRRAGETLSAADEVYVAYSIYGTGAGCPSRGPR